MSKSSNDVINGVDIINGNLSLTIIQLAWPSVLQAILANCYAFNDFLFVGHIPNVAASSAATAALSATVGLQIVAFAMHNIIPSGSNTYSAQYRGANNTPQLSCTFRAAFYACITVSSIVAIAGTCNVRFIAMMCNASPDVTQAIVDYFGTLLAASPAFGLMLLVDGFYKSNGDTQTPMKLEIGSLILNTLLNYIMVIELNWGIKGAATATGLSRLLPACIGLIGILTGRLGYQVKLWDSKSLDQPMITQHENNLMDDFSVHALEAGGSSPSTCGQHDMDITIVSDDHSEDHSLSTVSNSKSQYGKLTMNDVDSNENDEVEVIELTSFKMNRDVNATTLTLSEKVAGGGEGCNSSGGGDTGGAVTTAMLIADLGRRALLMASIGVFESINQFIYGIVFTILIRLSGELGYAQQAGLGAGMRGLEWIAFCMSEGFLVAAVTTVGQCIGAKQYERAMQAAWRCAAMSALCAGVTGLPFVLFSTQISSVLSKDPLIIKYCAQYIYALGFVMASVGWEIACYGAFLGAGQARTMCIMMGTMNTARVPIAVFLLYGRSLFWNRLLWAFGISNSYHIDPSGTFYSICEAMVSTALIKSCIFVCWLSYRTYTKLYFKDSNLVH